MAEEFESPVDETAEVAEPEESTPSEPEEEPQETPEEKQSKGVQKRIDELVRQREEARRDKEHWQQMAMQQTQRQEPQTQQPVYYPDLPEPQSGDFDTYDQYVKAVTKWNTQVSLRQYQEEQQARTRSQSVQQWHGAARERYADFGDVFNDSVFVSQNMAECLLDSDKGIEVAYFLGKNPAEARRIFNLPAHKQVYEMGKLESKLAAPPQRSKTGAPSPTSPVGGKELPSKKPEDMTLQEYESWRESGGGR